MRDVTTAELGYQPPQGTARLRRSLSEYVARTRGVIAAPENVMVGRGLGDLLSLVCRALRARGATRMAVEGYGHAGHRRIIEAAGFELVVLPVDDEGADTTILDDLDADAVLITAAHQFPVGVPLSSQRRRQVTEWAERVGGVILEDDYDGEFRYDRRAIGALQALSPARVVYLGTASKALAPAVGLAWAVVPDA